MPPAYNYNSPDIHSALPNATDITHPSGLDINSIFHSSAPVAFPVTPTGSESISPLIQLIMRLPSHLGVVSSFFEALSRLFLPVPADHLVGGLLDHTQNVISNLDSSISEHFPVDPSLLPPEASVLHQDLSSIASNSISHHQMEVSGLLDPSKPQFEPGLNTSTDGQAIISGPTLSNQSTSYLASAHPIFSDQLAGPGTLSHTAVPSTTNPLNVGATFLPNSSSTLSPDLASSEHSTFSLESTPDQQASFSTMPSSSSSLSDPTAIAYQPGTSSGGVIEELRAKELSLTDLKSIKTPIPHLNTTHPLSTAHPSALPDAAVHHSSYGAHPSHSVKLASHFKPTPGSTSSSTNSMEPVAGSNSPTTYTIRAGDCLWNIARHQLGSGTHWQDIYHLNQDLLGSNPDLIRPGVTIQLPDVNSSIPVAQHTVESGDSLWSIAAKHLGDGARWNEIYQANSAVLGSNPDLIVPGQQLTIPGDSVPIASSTPSVPSSTATSYTGVPDTGNSMPLSSSSNPPAVSAGAASADNTTDNPVTSIMQPDLSFLNNKQQP